MRREIIESERGSDNLVVYVMVATYSDRSDGTFEPTIEEVYALV